MTLPDFDPADHGFLPTLTPTTTRLLTALQVRAVHAFEDELTIALVADHIVTTCEHLTTPLRQLTRATLAFHTDPADSLVHLTAQVTECQDAPSAGVSVLHLAQLLMQEDFIRTGLDREFRRNVYAVAYRALLATQDAPSPDATLAGFDDALELADTALAFPASTGVVHN